MSTLTRSATLLSLLSLATATAAPAATDRDGCHVSAGPNDVVAKTGDVVIEPGRKVDSAVALKGSVTVKKGAVVKNAIAIRGDVVVEKGGTVEESVVTIEGQARIDGKVNGSRVSAHGDQVEIVSEDGDRVSFGAALAKKILAEVLKKLDGCAVVPEGK
jgi:NDP-sugar pyrophosphorylase family protein